MIKRLSAGKRRPDGATLVVAALLAALGALLVWQGASIPDKGGYAGIGSGDAPVFVGYGLWILAACHLVSALTQGAEPQLPPLVVPALWILGGLALQLSLLWVLGFALASALLFACTAAAFGKRNLALTFPVGLGLTLLIYGVFDQLLKLNLPAGPLEHLLFGG